MMKGNKKVLFAILAVALSLAALATVTAQTYSNVTTITGSSDQTTNYFAISSNEWRYTWSYSSTSEYAGFYIDVYQQGTDQLVDYFSASTNQTSGTQYIHNTEPGNYYIKILAANLDSYTINVEQQQASPTPTAPEFSGVAVILVLGVLVTASVLFVKKTRKQ